MIFLVYIWCLDCVCENEARGYVTRKGAAPGYRTPFAIPVEESFQGTMVDILHEICLCAGTPDREMPVLIFLFFRPE